MCKIKKFKMTTSTALQISYLITNFIFIATVSAQNPDYKPQVQILPDQNIQTLPVGKSLMLSCKLIVDDIKLVSDIQWLDNRGNVVQEKPNKNYSPVYDSKGRRLPTKTPTSKPPMHIEMIPSTNTLALFISSLQEAMSGTYTCKASYASSYNLNDTVDIITYHKITWKDAPEIQNPILGKDYKVKCDVTANPSPNIRWMKDGNFIESDGRYVIESDGLKIVNVKESDDGFYICRASVSETGETSERNIRVIVYVRPQIQPLPKEMEAIEGKSFQMSCNATGKPTPTFEWIKEQTQQNADKIDRFMVDSLKGTVQISKIEREDHGMYICNAKNDAGIVTSRTKLNVLIVPNIYGFENKSVAITKEAKIKCEATGRPAPEITFRRWGSEKEFVAGLQPNDDRIRLEQFFDEEGGKAKGILTISKLMRSDDGLYGCIARNRGDTAYKTGHITAEFPPNFDHMKNLPPVFSWQQRVANLSCLAMSIPNATIEWRWNGNLVKDLNDNFLRIDGTGPRSDLIVTPVDPRYYSVFTCIARNIHGEATHEMMLREAKIPEYVTSAKPHVVTATTISFEIIGPSSERGLPVTAYTVQYKEEYNPDWSQAFNRTWSPDSPYIVENLRPQTSYSFRFAAINQVGLGQWSANLVQSTSKRSAPEEPKTLHTPAQTDDGETLVISPYSDRFELRWSVPADNGEPIDYYEIKYCEGVKISGEWTNLDSDCKTDRIFQQTSYQMIDIKGSAYYQIELRAHNSIGFSTPADFIMKTARGQDVVRKVDTQVLSSAAIIGIVIGGVILLLLLIDVLCCLILRMGVLASLCRKTKRSPSEIDDETKLGSLYGWRFPLPYCSGQLVKEPPPSPLPLPPPVKLGGSPMASPQDEKEPLSSPSEGIKINSSVEFDGKYVHSRSGEIIGKNSAV